MPISSLSSARDVFRVWFTWKKQALFSALLTIFFIMCFAYLYTPDYESKASIMILPTTAEGAVISSSTEDLRIFPVTNQDINSEIELLTSPEVLRDTIRSFIEHRKKGKPRSLGLKKPSAGFIDTVTDTVKKNINDFLIFIKLKPKVSQFRYLVWLLSQAIKVEPVALSSVFDITLTAEQPKAAHRVLTRLLEVYISHHNKAVSKDEGLEFFEDQALHSHKKLTEYEQQYKKFKKEWSLIDFQAQNQANIKELSNLKEKLTLLDLNYHEIEGRITLLKEALAQNDKEIVYTKEMRTIPAMVELEKTIIPFLVQKTEFQKKFTPDSRKLIDLENQINSLRLEILREIEKAIKTNELEAASLQGKRNTLDKEIKQLQDTATQLNQQEATLNELHRKIDLYGYNYKLYTSKAENARIYAERRKHDLANLSIISKPVVPEKPSFPNRMLMLIISFAISFFVALGTPFLLEFIDHRVKTPQDVEKLLSMPVICSIPEAKN